MNREYPASLRCFCRTLTLIGSSSTIISSPSSGLPPLGDGVASQCDWPRQLPGGDMPAVGISATIMVGSGMPTVRISCIEALSGVNGGCHGSIVSLAGDVVSGCRPCWNSDGLTIRR